MLEKINMDLDDGFDIKGLYRYIHIFFLNLVLYIKLGYFSFKIFISRGADTFPAFPKNNVTFRYEIVHYY